MTTGWMIISVLTALGCAVAAGGFFVFSTFILQGLDRVPPSDAVAAMNGINVTAVRPPFMILIFGTAAGCVAVIIGGFINGGPAAILLIIGGLVYLLLPIGMTSAFHVPRNNALAQVDLQDARTAEIWSRYRREWVAGNHLRTIGALAAAILVCLGLVSR